MLSVEVDFIFDAIDSELHRYNGFRPIEVILENNYRLARHVENIINQSPIVLSRCFTAPLGYEELFRAVNLLSHCRVVDDVDDVADSFVLERVGIPEVEGQARPGDGGGSS
ncbi:hypothetical protein GCM10023063_42680 [Arthrobacter methylotrophus]